MEVPLRLTFKNLAPSAAVADSIKKMVAHLDKYYSRIISCQVVITVPHRHHHKGNLYEVHLDVRIPGKEFVIKQHQKQAIAHKSLSIALHEAFDAAKRALDEHREIERGHVKKVASNYAVGQVVRLLETLDDDQDFGFLQTEDGREIYFHRNTVLGKHYDQLEVGTRVRFVEEPGDSGPQATSISIIDRIRKAS